MWSHDQLATRFKIKFLHSAQGLVSNLYPLWSITGQLINQLYLDPSSQPLGRSPPPGGQQLIYKHSVTWLAMSSHVTSLLDLDPCSQPLGRSPPPGGPQLIYKHSVTWLAMSSHVTSLLYLDPCSQPLGRSPPPGGPQLISRHSGSDPLHSRSLVHVLKRVSHKISLQ